jgi:exosortase C (VPDSG-CTERM-specific)
MSRKYLYFGIFSAVSALAFGKVLCQWAVFGWGHDLFSHVLMVPFVSAYLIWIRRAEIGAGTKPAYGVGAGFLAGALLLLGGYWQTSQDGMNFSPADVLATQMLAFWCVLMSGLAFAFGTATLLRFCFALGFLLFAIPFPDFLTDWVARGLQLGSADAAEFLLRLSGMPVLRDGTRFDLPGFTMNVAPECSGIHSTLVLFIVSCVAGYLLLRTTRNRFILVLAVIPLALLRNGLRIFTIGQLCVNVDPDMIDSYIHRKGGPIFFALSLIPFFALLLFLRKREERASVQLELKRSKPNEKDN